MRAAVSGFAVVCALAGTLAAADAGDGARTAAATFGRALTAGSAEALRPILPEHGRVRLSLARLGPEDGLFGANQVVALFRDFLSRGKVAAFHVVRCEGDQKHSALAHGTASIIDRDGRSGRIGLHLAFEQEGARWVVREVRESAE